MYISNQKMDNGEGLGTCVLAIKKWIMVKAWERVYVSNQKIDNGEGLGMCVC